MRGCWEKAASPRMMWKISLTLATMVSTAVATNTNDYTDKRASVGEFYPPPPNARETKHLEAHLHDSSE